jgi:hypothetical protein
MVISPQANALDRLVMETAAHIEGPDPEVLPSEIIQVKFQDSHTEDVYLAQTVPLRAASKVVAVYAVLPDNKSFRLPNRPFHQRANLGVLFTTTSEPEETEISRTFEALRRIDASKVLAATGITETYIPNQY